MEPPHTEASLEIADIARIVFTPNSRGNIGLITDASDGEYVFEMLSNLLIEGLYCLYGTALNIDNINDHMFVTLCECMNRVGFSIHKHYTKKDDSYARILKCSLENNRPYVFVLTGINVPNNELASYYVDAGNFQISFTHNVT